MTEQQTAREIERLNHKLDQLRHERDHVAYLLLAAEQQVARLLAMKESVPDTPPPAAPPAPTKSSRPQKPISTVKRAKRRIKRALAAQ